MRDTVGRDACGTPRDAVSVARAATHRLELRVVVRGDPDEHADGRTRQSLGDLAAVFERLPGDLQEQPLLRVDEDRLARGDAEEVGIELVDLLQESPAPGDVQTPQSLVIPARGRNRANSLDSVTEKSPECHGPVRAREPAADADDRDRLATLAPDGLNLSPIDFGARLAGENVASASIVG